MPFNLTRESFTALQTRRQITGNNEGIRTIATASTQIENSSGLLSLIIQGVGDLTGFLFSGLKTVLSTIEFTATNILEWFKEGFDYVWEFNFQITDEELDNQIKSLFNSIQTRVFGVLGKQIGSIVATGIGGAIAFYINPVIAKLLLANTADDFFVEILSDIRGLLLLTAQSAVKAGFLVAFKNTRAFIRKAYKDPTLRAISANLGIAPEIIDQWGEKKGASWSFSEKKQQLIEEIEDQQYQNNVEEFTGEFSDGFWDRAMKMAFMWDQLHLQAVDRGASQTLIYEPNRANESERVYLRGTPEELRNQVISINANRALLDNRDIGQVVVTEDDQPVTVGNGIKVVFKFINFKERPYYAGERRNKVRRSRPGVPNCKKSMLSWENIKSVFSGESAFTDGDYWARADLSNGKQLKCYGVSENEAQKLVEKLASFSSADIIYPIDTGRKRGFSRSLRLREGKKEQPMYLYEIEIINFDRATKYQEIGEIENSKNNIVTKLKMDFPQKPSWWDDDLSKALSSSID